MLFYCLLQHPDAYVRLQEEVDKFCPLGEDPTATKHHREMTFLMAEILGEKKYSPPRLTTQSVGRVSD